MILMNEEAGRTSKEDVRTGRHVHGRQGKAHRGDVVYDVRFVVLSSRRRNTHRGRQQACWSAPVRGARARAHDHWCVNQKAVRSVPLWRGPSACTQIWSNERCARGPPASNHEAIAQCLHALKSRCSSQSQQRTAFILRQGKSSHSVLKSCRPHA
jgi:hypothetical protein